MCNLDRVTVLAQRSQIAGNALIHAAKGNLFNGRDHICEPLRQQAEYITAPRLVPFDPVAQGRRRDQHCFDIGFGYGEGREAAIAEDTSAVMTQLSDGSM